MKNDVKSKHLEIGELGENIACRFLKEKGFEILGRNYRKKWGEIDIIAKKSGIIHFVEVKSVSRITLSDDVIRETSADQFQPEDEIHLWKQKRLQRAIQSYLLEKKIPEDSEWQFDALAVFIDMPKKISKVRFTENIVF